MKIAVDCRWSGKSGVGSFLDGALPYFLHSNNEFIFLAAKNNLGHLKSVLSDDKKFDGLCGANFQIVICEVKAFSLCEALFFPRSVLKMINACDAYFSPYFNIPGGMKIPIYTTIHDVVFLDMPYLAGKIGTFARKVFYMNAVKKSRAIFTVSFFSKSRIRKNLKCKSPVLVAPNGIPRHFEKWAAAARKIEKTNTIIFIGNIKRQKGLSTLLDAFPEIHEKTAARLLIVGSAENFRTKDGEISKKIAAANKKTGGSVEFTGFVENDALCSLLCAARILAQPSLYEGFGLPPLEALFCGTRAVISDIEVFREIYKNLPVTFFKAGDAPDLAEKICEVWSKNETVPPFENPYLFEKTAEKILEGISNGLK